MSDIITEQPVYTPPAEGLRAERIAVKKELRFYGQELDELDSLHRVFIVTDRTLKSIRRGVEHDQQLKEATQGLAGVLFAKDVLSKESSGEPKDKGVTPEIAGEDQIGLWTDKLNNYLSDNHGNLIRVLQETSDKVRPEETISSGGRRDQLRSEVGWIVVRYLQELGGMSKRPDPHDSALQRVIMATYGETEFGKATGASTQQRETNSLVNQVRLSPSPGETLKELTAHLNAKKDLLRADPSTQSLLSREWLQNAYKLQESGIKIFPTPFYEMLIRRMEQIGEKENGVGGIVLYGPPGVGKTEVAAEYARRLGFPARVISIHYWSTFSQLIGEEAVHVAQEGSHKYFDALGKRASYFESLSDEDFSHFAKQFLNNSTRELPDQMSERDIDLLVHFAGKSSERLKGKKVDEMSKDDWTALRLGMVDYLKSQQFSAALGENMDPTDSFISGELLLCIERGELPVLDELDKMGPFAPAALSRILTLSPGQELTVRGRKVQIPDWFRIHATSNELALGGKNQYLYDRFNHVFVDFPPAQDMLHIAGGWMTDRDGNLGAPPNSLKPVEQIQLGYFYLTILPEIQDLYRSGKLNQPVTLRGLHELCNLLVSPTTRKRTSLSVYEAIERALLEQRSLAKQDNLEGTSSPETSEKVLRELLVKHKDVLQEPIQTLTATEKAQFVDSKAQIESYIANIIESPWFALMNFSEGRTEQGKFTGVFGGLLERSRFSTIKLSDLDQLRAKVKLSKAKENTPQSKSEQLRKDGFVQTNVGLALTKIRDALELSFIDGDGKVVLSRETYLGQALGVSDIGDVIWSKSTSGKDKAPTYSVQGFSREVPNAQFDRQENDTVVGVFPNGEGMAIVRGEETLLYLPWANKEHLKIKVLSKRATASPNGRFIVLETAQGKSWAIDLLKHVRRKSDLVNQPDAILPSSGEWNFVGNNLLAQVGNPTGVIINYV